MFGVTEWIVIAGIGLILFGASRIPAIGEGLGRGINNFRKSIKAGSDDVEKKDN